MSSGFDHIPERDDPGIPPAPKGFIPIQEWAEKALDPRWEISDPAWQEWDFAMLSDEQLLRRYRDASAELQAQALELTDDGHFVPRQFSEEELTRARALVNYWRTWAEVHLRHELRRVMQALAEVGGSHGNS